MSTVTKETFWTQIVEDPTLYGTITTEDNLFNYRSDAVWQVMNESFITNGTNFEVTKWEELLGLDVVETTLNSRKAAILNHITENLPITIGILEQLVKKLTDGDYKLEYNETENELTLEFPENFENDIKEITPRLIPIVSKVDYIISLPDGYISAEFLESTGSQYIYIPSLAWENDVARWTMPPQPARNGSTAINMWWGTADTSSRCRVFYHFNMKKIIIDWGSQSEVSFSEQPSGSFALETGGITVNGDVYSINSNEFAGLEGLYIFANTISTTKYIGYTRISTFTVSQKCDVISALNKNGVPCMYDKVSRQSFYNSGSGQFIVGLNKTQALKLSTLPATSASLTISLPAGYETDEGVTNALDIARSKGWTLTIQTYTPEASESATSTFGMRRIWVRKSQDENGTYVDADGNRFQVEWCVEIYSPDNTTPEDHGYEQFRSVEAAVEYWELTPYVDPTLEEQINSNEQE